MNQLEEARKEIDRIDQELAVLFEQRMHAVSAVADYKKQQGLPVFDGTREREVIERNAGRIEDETLREPFEDWIIHLMNLSKKRQRELLGADVVAYCGIEGAFAHSVSRRLFSQNRLMGCASFDEVFEAVTSGQARYGVLPLENSRSGMVGEVLDGLMASDIYIVQAADVKIRQCLLGLPEASLSDIEWVYSKDQALWQASAFIKAIEARPIPYPNTAMAAQYVSQSGDVSKAAIGSRDNARLYGLKILAENIEADTSNTTRFIVIAARPNAEEKEYTSFFVSLSSEVGSLARAINVVSSFGLNMNCLLSRPRAGHPFEYFFYIQTEGKIPKEKMDTCMKALDQICAFSKWLGSYSIRKELEQ